LFTAEFFPNKCFPAEWSDSIFSGKHAFRIILKEIADRLHISEGTVKGHLSNIFEELELDSRMALLRYTQEKGLALIPRFPQCRCQHLMRLPA